MTEPKQRKEKFPESDINITLEAAVNSVVRTQNGEDTQKKEQEQRGPGIPAISKFNHTSSLFLLAVLEHHFP